MTVFLPTDLETHLMVHHGVDSHVIAQVEQSHPEKRDDVAEISHDLMHQMQVADHVHDMDEG